MILRPRLLLLDEPTEGIQPDIIQQIGRVIDYLRGRGEMAIIPVEQYFDVADALVDRFYVLKRGAVALSGTKAEIPEADLRAAVSV
jgi:urea transport system ATP-binding protein